MNTGVGCRPTARPWILPFRPDPGLACADLQLMTLTAAAQMPLCVCVCVCDYPYVLYGEGV